MGRPPGKIHDRPFQMRVSDRFLKSVDRWRAKQQDGPSRAEAIRRLVGLGLEALPAAPQPKTKKTAKKASEMAGSMIDWLADQSAPPEEQAKRKRRLVKGPAEFRDIREDHPKAKPGR